MRHALALVILEAREVFVYPLRRKMRTLSQKISMSLSRDKTARSSISRGIASKIIPNLPILRINHEFKGIIVNMGRIHSELNNFLT